LKQENEAPHPSPSPFGPESGTSVAPTSQPAAQSQTLSKTELLTLLNIPQQLARDSGSQECGEQGLRFNYQKYQACLNAVHKLGQMVKDGQWPGRKPSETEVVELFVSKSMWYSHFKKLFSKVPRYPQMQKWLKGGEDAPEEYELWKRRVSTLSRTSLSG
jgi:hypothetical protein